LLEQLLKNGFNLSKRDFGAGYKCFRVSGDNLVCEYGDTAQHAICKTIVAYCSGDEVEIPSELLG
jgi:hypothetical protein